MTKQRTKPPANPPLVTVLAALDAAATLYITDRPAAFDALLTARQQLAHHLNAVYNRQTGCHEVQA